MRAVVSVALMVCSLVVATPARALFHLAEIHEAMSGANGEPALQYVEIRMLAVSQNLVAHSRLTTFGCTGTPVNVLINDLPGNVATAGANVRWIMASESTAGAFLAEFGIVPDFTFPSGIAPACGNVCWGAPGLLPPNPPAWDPTLPANYVDCLAYGGYTGPLKAGQQVVAGPLGDGTQSLSRGTTTGSAFTLECPTPENNAGVVGSLASCTTTTTSSTTTTTVPAGAGIAIDGTKLSLKDDPTSALKRKATVVSKDPDISLGGGNGSADDPRTAGALVRIVSAAGDVFDDTYTLPPSGWALIGAEGENKGYKYKDSLLANGPVKVAVLKPAKQLKVVAKGSGLGHTLLANPNPVDVVVTIGGLTYCQHYGGTVAFKTPKVYAAKLAPAGTCP